MYSLVADQKLAALGHDADRLAIWSNLQEAKEAKKRRHEAEKERAKKIREKEERRALRALQQLSESSSEESDGVNSDLTDEDEITSRKGRSRRRSSVSRK